MKIPPFNNTKVVDENGYLTQEWRSILQALFEGLQYQVSDEGLIVPSQSAANIALLTSSPVGALVYDSDNDLAKINIAGSWKTITTS